MGFIARSTASATSREGARPGFIDVRFGEAFFGAVFLVDNRFTAVFFPPGLATNFFTAGFVAAPFFTVGFCTETFFEAVLFVTDLFAATFFEAAFFITGFFTATFFAAVFLGTPFFIAGFFAATFFAGAVFLTAAFFPAVRFGAGFRADEADFFVALLRPGASFFTGFLRAGAFFTPCCFAMIVRCWFVEWSMGSITHWSTLLLIGCRYLPGRPCHWSLLPGTTTDKALLRSARAPYPLGPYGGASPSRAIRSTITTGNARTQRRGRYAIQRISLAA